MTVRDLYDSHHKHTGHLGFRQMILWPSDHIVTDDELIVYRYSCLECRYVIYEGVLADSWGAIPAAIVQDVMAEV